MLSPDIPVQSIAQPQLPVELQVADQPMEAHSQTPERHDMRKWKASLLLGTAALCSLMEMGKGEAKVIVDELHAASEVAMVQVDDFYMHSDNINTAINQAMDRSQHIEHQDDKHGNHQRLQDDAWAQASRDMTDFARAMEEGPVPLKPGNLPHTKLPFTIDLDKPKAKKSNTIPRKKLPFPIDENTPTNSGNTLIHH